MATETADQPGVRRAPPKPHPARLSGAPAGDAGLAQRVQDLLESAHDVLTRQGVVRHLLEPADAREQAAGPAALLPHFVAVAREFTAAAAAGVGVVTADRQFRFVGDRVGLGLHGPENLPAELAAQAGRVVVQGRTLRLSSASGHPALLGFPPDHGRAGSFLGVPIPARERVGGYLYVLDKQGSDSFTADDQAMLEALAPLTPTGDTEPAPPDGAEPAAPLHLLLHAARSLGAADTAAVVLPDEGGVLRVADADGEPWADVAGRPVTAPRSVSALAAGIGETVLVDDATTDSRTSPATDSPGIGPLLAAPLLAGGRPCGVLTLGRAAGRRPFDGDDSDVVTALAAHAGLLVDLASRSMPETPDPGAAGGRAEFAARLDSDVRDRLVVYAATLHALGTPPRRNRVLTDLLRQARDLRRQLQEGAAIIWDIGTAPDVHPVSWDGDDAPVPCGSGRHAGDGSDLDTRLVQVNRQLHEILACPDIDELAARVVQDVLDDLACLLPDGRRPQARTRDDTGTGASDRHVAGDPDHRLHIRVERTRRCSVIHLDGCLSLATASAVSTAVAKELAEGPVGVVIGLADVSLGDELGLNVIPTVARRAERQREIRVVVAAPPECALPRLRRAAREVDVFDTVSAAVRALRTDGHPRTFRLGLPLGPAASLQARRLVEHACLTWRQDHVCDDALLITTELVANAIQHGRAPAELVISRRKRHLLIEVADSAPQPPALLGPAHATDRHGLGLVLVDTLSTSWGCRQSPTGKTTWAMLRIA